MAMFEGGFIPGFFHFLTMNLFDGIKGNTNWIGVIAMVGVVVWIIYRLSGSDSGSVGGSGGYRLE